MSGGRVQSSPNVVVLPIERPSNESETPNEEKVPQTKGNNVQGTFISFPQKNVIPIILTLKVGNDKHRFQHTAKLTLGNASKIQSRGGRPVQSMFLNATTSTYTFIIR